MSGRNQQKAQPEGILSRSSGRFLNLRIQLNGHSSLSMQCSISVRLAGPPKHVVTKCSLPRGSVEGNKTSLIGLGRSIGMAIP